MEQELYIDGQVADIGDGTDVMLQFKSNVLSDITKIEGNTTLTIRLPLTQGNRRIIENCEQLHSATDYNWRYHRVTYRRNGVTIVDDSLLYVTGVDEDTINCVIVWGLYEAFAKIKSKDMKLRELGTTTVSWTGHNEPTAWSDFAASDVYFANLQMFYEPIVSDAWNVVSLFEKKKGKRSGLFSRYLHPVVAVKYVIGKIEQVCGVTFHFPQVAQTVIDTMGIVLVDKKAGEESFPQATTGETGQSYTTGGYVSPVFSYVDASLFEVVTVDNITKLRVKVTMDYNVSMLCGIHYNMNGWTVEDGKYTFAGGCVVMVVEREEQRFYYSCGTMKGDPVSVPVPAAGSTIDDTIEGSGNVQLEAGDVLSWCMAWQKYVERWWEGEYRPEWYFERMELNPPTQWDNVYIRIKVASVDGDVPEYGLFPIERNLPDVKLLDFVKFLCAYLGIYPLQIPSKADIYFANYAEAFNEAHAVDWTGKLVAQTEENRPKEVTFHPDGWARNNWYRWTEDERTEVNADYDLTIADETMQVERDIIRFPFAAGEENKIPCYYLSDDGIAQYSACKPRLIKAFNQDGIVGGVFDADWSERLAASVMRLQSALNNASVIKERMMLTDIDLQAFDERKPVWLAQYGRYYVVLNIKQSSDMAAEVTMLQIKDVQTLPYDAEVEWLESVDGAYIDTGIVGYSDLKFNIHLIASSSHTGSIFGSRISATSGLYTVFCKNASGASDNGIRWSFGGQNVYVNSKRTMLATGREVVMRNNPQPRSMTYDETYTVTANNVTFNNNQNIHLFGLNNNGAHSNIQSGTVKVLSFTLSQGAETLLDLIPVRRGTTGYMYDRVSGQMFRNAGTGSFLIGADKE